MEKYKILPGLYYKGALVMEQGVNFSIFSKNAERVTLEIYKEALETEPHFSYELDPVLNRTGDTWHVYVGGIPEGYYYGWRVGGPFDLKRGHRYDYSKLLLDPYAKAITPKLQGHERKGIVIDSRKFNFSKHRKPETHYRDSIIYEMHIKLFTMNKNSGVSYPGSYIGVIEKINHLKDLGVTAVELLPVFEFDEDSILGSNPVTGEKLKNVWGYNPIAFYAPTSNYLSNREEVTGALLGDHVVEFSKLVAAFHDAGIEVILDVVFNHTGEGNEMGPTISLKGLDNSIYYMLEPYNKMYYSNYSGTGNTLNCSHPVVKEYILDCLRYWYGQMHVDGFRFDLASILGRGKNGQWLGNLSILNDISKDSVLSRAKLIAEGWDAAGGYFLGEFPEGWAEWNGKFRDTVRRFIKGDPGMTSDLATRIVGSPDLFANDGRRPYYSINFITAHDGFTMWDLVSYNEKNNHINGEHNRDGDDHNNSWNHGVEGETEDPHIISLRKRQIKNMMVILMVSQGTPMILMGDEMGKTQQGNNNAYCQDNELNWLDWKRFKEFEDIYLFTKRMIKFRKKNISLRRKHFFTATDTNGNGLSDISWHGTKPYKADWSHESRVLAFMVDEGREENSSQIYVAFNSHYEDLEFELPEVQGKKWFRVVDTGNSQEDFLETPRPLAGGSYRVKARSSIVLIAK